MGSQFFSALSRVRQIHDNCRALLRTHHQRAGLELMDMMATYQETAYERLCRCAHANMPTCLYTWHIRGAPGSLAAKPLVVMMPDIMAFACTGNITRARQVILCWTIFI